LGHLGELFHVVWNEYGSGVLVVQN